MKNFLIAFSFLFCFFASTQASYLRVINAVPESQVLDVYFNVPNSNEKIRLFKDLNSTDIPPYFFVTVPQGNSTVSLTFMFKDSANFSAPQATSQELEGMPTYNASMRAGNFSYTLVVALAASQNSESENVSDSQSNNSQYDFLLLSDRAQGDEPPSGMQVIRLVNIAPQADFISLITFGSQCPQSTGNNSQSGDDSANQDSSSDNSTDVSGDGMQSNTSAIIPELPYLQSSDYVQLPQGVTPQDLVVCYQGQMIPVVPVTALKKDAKQFSILLFTGIQSQIGNETFENENQTFGNETLENGNDNETSTNENETSVNENETSSSQGGGSYGDQGQGDQSQGGDESQNGDQSQDGDESQNVDQNQDGSQTQGDNFIATLVDDEPDTTQNIRVRIIHAAPGVPAVSILLDGRTIFPNVTFGNVTQYTMIMRGIHNITAIPASQQNNTQQNNSQSSSSDISLPIIAFFAWRNTYTVAIVPTGMSMESSETLPEESLNSTDTFPEESLNSTDTFPEESLNSTDTFPEESLNSTDETSNSSETQNQLEAMIPGFRGPYHQIFEDRVSDNTTLGQNLAYIQVVHLAQNISAVDVSIGDYNITNLQFLSSTHYINVTATGSTNITITESENESSNPIAEVSRNLQANTLYTLWILGSENGSPIVIVTTDRKVKITCVMDDASDSNM